MSTREGSQLSKLATFDEIAHAPGENFRDQTTDGFMWA